MSHHDLSFQLFYEIKKDYVRHQYFYKKLTKPIYIMNDFL